MSRKAGSSALIIASLLLPIAHLAAARTTERTIRPYVIVHGDSTSGSWDDSDSPATEELRAHFGDRFAWFRKDGHEYIVTASTVMDELDRAMEPQKNVNRMQAGVNREQSRVNQMQAGVNAHQRDVNALQAEANASQTREDQNRVNRRQADVNEEQSRVNAEQAKVNAMQQKVNEEQHRVSAEFDRRVEEIFNSTLRSGAATKLR